MNFLVFSDIHGSLPSARLAVEKANTVQPDAVILLGDLLYHGPRNPIPEGYDPAGVARVLGRLSCRVIAVRGNCDSDVDAMVLPFPLAPDFSWLLAGGIGIFATHGHVLTPEKLPPLAEGDVFLYGHTHIPMARMQGDIAVCNPGSLTLPKEDHPASYGHFENGRFSVITRDGEEYLRLDCL